MIAVRELEVAFGDRVVARVAHLDVAPGEIVGVAGESGSGKSMTALALLGLAGSVGARVRGSITLDGDELVGMSERRLRALRGRRIAMVMQSPRSAFTPTFRLRSLFERTLRLHGIDGEQRRARIAAGLAELRLDDGLLDRYPHQVSGGQAQRLAIALAVALRAEVLIADEPTSALDVTVQAELLSVFERLRDELGTAIVLITHDLAVIGRIASRVVVMRQGAVVEQGPVDEVLTAPRDPYTRELIEAVPQIGRDRPSSVGA